MKRLFAAILLALLGMPLAFGGTYKWVDKDGNVHYSDKPVEGAEQVELPAPTTFNAPDISPARDDRSADNGAEPAAKYTEFDFISPKTDQVFWATGGEIPVQLDIKPALRRGHVINLYFNGELTADSPMTTLGTMLTGAIRGAHTVRAVVVDMSGQEIDATESVTFHVKQRSIANPKKPPVKR